jgi:hypothetical protein
MLTQKGVQLGVTLGGLPSRDFTSGIRHQRLRPDDVAREPDAGAEFMPVLLCRLLVQQDGRVLTRIFRAQMHPTAAR